jgi:hypothetical protein
LSGEYEEESVLFAACDGKIADLKAVGDNYTIGELVRWMQFNVYRNYVDREQMKS